MKFISNLSLLIALFFLFSCAPEGPAEFQLGKDQCDYCKMTITEAKYATQIQTEKGRLYKFDDIKCLRGYRSSNEEQTKNASEYYVDFPTGAIIPASQATLITGGLIKSPMGGNTQAYENLEQAQKAAAELEAELVE